MGNRQSEEDEEYENIYDKNQNKSKLKNIMEYENLTHNDRYDAGAHLPIKENTDSFEIENKRSKNVLISKVER